MAKKPTMSRNASLIDSTAKATQAITNAVTGRRKGSEGISIHVHVGDLILIGFDEAIDAEEWGAREINNEGAAGSARSSAQQDAEPERKTKRRISFRKGDVQVTADEEAEPAGAPSRRKPGRAASARKKSAAPKKTAGRKRK
jgi:hypothetical protein